MISSTPFAAIIRPRTDSDFPALARLLNEVHQRDGYPVEEVADPKGWLTPPGILGAWVAQVEDQVVGHVLLTHPASGDDAANLWSTRSATPLTSIAVLGRLFLASATRGHHLGRRLTTRATLQARDLDRRAVLDVMAKDRAAIRTYEALGWQQFGTITHHFGDGRTEPALAYVSPADGE